MLDGPVFSSFGGQRFGGRRRMVSVPEPAAGIALRGYVTAVGDGSGTTTLSLTTLTGGSGTAAMPGDLVLVLYGEAASTTREGTVTTSGYSEAFAHLFSNDGNDANADGEFKFMTAPADTQVVISGGVASTSGNIIAAIVLSGVDPSTPLDVASTTSIGKDTVLADPPAITPVTAGALIVTFAVGAAAGSAGVGLFAHSTKTSLINMPDDDAKFSLLFWVSIDEWTGGTSNPVAFTITGTDNIAYSWASAQIALRPA